MTIAKATKAEQRELARLAAELEREGHYTLAYRNWSRVEGGGRNIVPSFAVRNSLRRRINSDY